MKRRQRRPFEYVLPKDFPTSRKPGTVDRFALTQALRDLEKREVGDVLRLAVPHEDRDRLAYLVKMTHTYNERLGLRMEIQARVRDGWLYLRKKTNEPRMTFDRLAAEAHGAKKRTPLAERCYRNDLAREGEEGKRA